MMRKIFYIVIMLVPLMFNGAASYAMPPHPDLLKKWRDEGTYEANMKKVQSVQNLPVSKNMDENKSSSKASGPMKIPVILVKYSNTTTAFSVYGKTDFSTLLNAGTSPGYLSARKYYNDMSNGNLTIQFDVFDPVSVSKTLSYYGSNDVSDVDGDGDFTEDLHPGELVHEAIDALIAANDSVDFGDYDNDNDGYIDTVIIIHAGAGEETSGADEEIWSHQWDLYSAGAGVVTTDGVKFSVYTIQPEYVETAGDSTIGVFCHELGHVFGLPDLYDTSNATNGAGNWSLMANGAWGGGDGSRPAPLLAWERSFAGGSSWVSFANINPVAIIKHRDRGPVCLLVILITLMAVTCAVSRQVKCPRSIAVPASLFMLVIVVSCSIDVESDPVIFDGSIYDIESSHQVYSIPLTSGQYLILEGKTAATTSGWYVPGTGVLVTHIHNGIISSYYSTNSVNAGASRVHGVNIVEADGGNDLWDPSDITGDNGTASDLFCSQTKSSLTTSTTPNTKYYTGTGISSKTGNSGVSITSFSSRLSWPITFHAEY